ncbi:MAG: cob(I)yrinic acid a,c-diamide adenosyltransferase [Bacteroidota bacterium]
MATKIYTKTGDRGETSLFGGERVPKDTLRVEAIGTIDELNSLLGIIRSQELPEEIEEIIGKIQNDLFVIGADLAARYQKGKKPSVPRLKPRRTEVLEKYIDTMGEHLVELRSFILPEGVRPAAELHFARTVCRRAERLIVRLSRSEKITATIIPYMNRLSDLLFILARRVNDIKDHHERVWPQK